MDDAQAIVDKYSHESGQVGCPTRPESREENPRRARWRMKNGGISGPQGVRGRPPLVKSTSMMAQAPIRPHRRFRTSMALNPNGTSQCFDAVEQAPAMEQQRMRGIPLVSACRSRVGPVPKLEYCQCHHGPHAGFNQLRMWASWMRRQPRRVLHRLNHAHRHPKARR